MKMHQNRSLTKLILVKINVAVNASKKCKETGVKECQTEKKR